MKHKFKRLLSAVSAAAITIATLPTACLSTSAQEMVVEAPDVNTYASDVESVKPVTREEWIHDLVTVFQMSVEDDSTIESHFTDTADSPYAYDIDLAANYGVFDIESESFNPDGFVTREFAAHTANYCFGYLDDGTTVTFADSDDIYYEYDAIVSVQKGWFTPSSGKFLPDMVFTEKEAENILSEAKASLESVIINENADHTIDYANSVVQLDDSVNAYYFNGTVTIKGTSVSVKKGNIFCVNIDGMDKLYKADSVTRDDEGNTIIAVTDAALKDAVSAIDIQGYGDVDYSNAMFYGTSSSSDKVKLLQYKPGISGINGVQSQLVKAVNISGDTITIDEEIDMGGTSVKLNGTIKNIKPEYKLDYDGVNVNSFYLNVDADADISCTMTGKLIKDTSSKEVNLAKVPVNLGGPMSANIVISVSVSVSGEITMKYSWDINSGVSYTKAGGWRVTKDFKKKGFSLTASGSEKIAIKAALNAEVFGCEIGELYVMGGESGKFTNTPQNNGAVFCDNLKVYAFAEAGANLNLFDVVSFSQSYEFINFNNSPLRYNKHWENGVEVAECSFDKSATSTTSKRTSNKASSYSNYSTYGLEYDGIITLANSADSDDYTPYQTWTESKKLTGNVTVDGDLYLKNSVNLNGYTLTVTGDLIQSSGQVSVGNGTLNVNGSYEISSDGYICMTVSNGSINVSKDFVMKSNVYCSNYYDSDSNLTNGMMSIGGNFYQYNNGTRTDNFVQKGTEIKFFGSSVHEIHFDSVNSYFTDISTTDGAKLKFTGKMHGFQLNNDMTFVGNTKLDAGTLHLCANHLTIEGDFTQNSTVDLWSGILDIKGNHIINDSLYNNGESWVTVNVDKQVEMNSGSLDLGDITMNISSDLIQNGGRMNISNGTLNVNGSYEISSDGYICMTVSNGSINVSKDFVMKSNVYCSNHYDSDSNLTNGMMSIGGNFYQYNNGTRTDNFVQKGTEIKFVGSGIHDIHSQSANTTISNIILTNGASISFNGKLNGFSAINSCVFSSSDTTVANVSGNTVQSVSAGYATLKIDDNSSIELTVENVVTGDANGDGKFTVADAVILQKWLLAVPHVRLANWEACDLCEDGKIDVFDLCVLKRKLVNG